MAKKTEEEPKVATTKKEGEEAKIDDDEFEEFEIDQEWVAKEDGKEVIQQWEDDWDDDDVNDDFSSYLRWELENNAEKNLSDIDEDLHSRHLALYGRGTMRRLFESNILVSGMQGLGAEIAKNLILAGVKSVTLHDTGKVELWDLSSNFFFTEDDIGMNRADASIQKMQNLNNSVVISTLTTELTTEHLSDFQAVVFTDISLEKAIEFDKFCHNHDPPIAFIKSEVRGLFGSVFCDFGPNFTVYDVDGEDPHTGIIEYISNAELPLVCCIDDERLKFQDGDLVKFSEIHGMSELNGGKPKKVRNSEPYCFNIDVDTTEFGEYQKGGIVTQLKEPKVLNFKPLHEALKDPGEFLYNDSSKSDHPPLLHLLFQALDKLLIKLGRYPKPGSEEDACMFLSMVNILNNEREEEKLDKIDEQIVTNFAFGARAVLNPMAAIFGGIVGQEVVKACSGKFHPLFQFFYFDSLESLPVDPLVPDDLKLPGNRYDAQISVFGDKLHKKLEEAKVFVVGSGALGCEFLKNLALMGVSCGNGGKLTITDDDVIEKSNLTNHFLFRNGDIDQPKSTVAEKAASLINPSINIEALQHRVCPETVFADTFWKNHSFVVNALDNENARLYIDQKCLYFNKPLLESRTLGAKCNTQMFIPNLTENYGASRDPPEKQASTCEVESFPHKIDHCLTWARSEFEELFENTPAEAIAYMSDPKKYTDAKVNAGDPQARDTLERVYKYLEKERCKSWRDCISWARKKFEDYFANRVKQLIFTYPRDPVDELMPFWSAPKRFPRPLEFSVEDPSHLNFVVAASVLRAKTYEISFPEWVKSPRECAKTYEISFSEWVKVLREVTVPVFEPKKNVKFVIDPDFTRKQIAANDDRDVIDDLVKKLNVLSLDFKMKPIQFKKDDDSNYHMDLIAGLANMRAKNYHIPEVDKLKAKLIVGRVIPAIATATAMATGLVCLELYKVLDGCHKVEDYRNTSANLALPLFKMAKPVSAKVIKHRDESWTVWDRWIRNNDPTLRELINWLQEKGLTVTSINFGSCLLYNSMILKHMKRLDEKLLILAKVITNAALPSHRKYIDLVVACEDEEKKYVDIPPVSIYYGR